MAVSWKLTAELGDMSFQDAHAGETTPVEIKIEKNGITVDLWPDKNGETRTVWIEMSAGSVMVRTYDYAHESPMTIQIDSKGQVYDGEAYIDEHVDLVKQGVLKE